VKRGKREKQWRKKKEVKKKQAKFKCRIGYGGWWRSGRR
jgi:hypothetical protein